MTCPRSPSQSKAGWAPAGLSSPCCFHSSTVQLHLVGHLVGMQRVISPHCPGCRNTSWKVFRRRRTGHQLGTTSRLPPFEKQGNEWCFPPGPHSGKPHSGLSHSGSIHGGWELRAAKDAVSSISASGIGWRRGLICLVLPECGPGPSFLGKRRVGG